MSHHSDALRDGVAPLLFPGEEVRAALVVSPRGGTTAAAGGPVAGLIGSAWAGHNAKGAETVGLVVRRSCGLVLTDRRLITLDLGISLLGAVKEVKGLLSEVSIATIEALESKRVGAGGVVTITAQGATFKLEAKPGPARELAEAFAATR